MNKEIHKENKFLLDKNCRLAIFEKAIKDLREMIKIQCDDGNWNFDPYMFGMANGMIFSLSLFDNKEPEYLEEPNKWLKDISNIEKPVVFYE